MDAPTLQPYADGMLGDIIKPYLSEDGKTFALNFWMSERVGAMVGASVAEYNEANFVLGGFGFNTDSRPLHTHILGPDVEGARWNEVMTTPGDNGWNPRGRSYEWNPAFGDTQNNAVWVSCGCPSISDYGEWGDQGVPMELHLWRQSLGNRVPGGGVPYKGGRGKRRRWR